MKNKFLQIILVLSVCAIFFFSNITMVNKFQTALYRLNIFAKNSYTFRDVPVGFFIPIPKTELKDAGYSNLEKYITIEYFLFSEIEYDVIPELTISIVRGDIINEKETLVLIDMDFHGYEFPKMIDDYQEYYDYLFFILGISFFEDETLTNKCQLSRIEGTEEVGYFHAECDVETDVLYLGRKEFVTDPAGDLQLYDIDGDEKRPMKFETKSILIDPSTSDLCATHRCIENKPVYCIDEEVMGNQFLEGPIFNNENVRFSFDNSVLSYSNISRYSYIYAFGNIESLNLGFYNDDSFEYVTTFYNSEFSEFINNNIHYSIEYSLEQPYNRSYVFQLFHSFDGNEENEYSSITKANLVKVSTTDGIDYIWDMNCHINQ